MKTFITPPRGRCASCEGEIPGRPVYRMDEAYCCLGCAAGGPVHVHLRGRPGRRRRQRARPRVPDRVAGPRGGRLTRRQVAGAASRSARHSSTRIAIRWTSQ